MDEIRTRLRSAIHALVHSNQRGEVVHALLKLATLFADADAVWDRLGDLERTDIAASLDTLGDYSTLSEPELLANADIARNRLHRHESTLRLKATRATTFRLPAIAELLFANQLVTGASEAVSDLTLSLAVAGARAVPADADAFDRTARLVSAILAARPFVHSNTTTAALAAIGTLGANGHGLSSELVAMANLQSTVISGPSELAEALRRCAPDDEITDAATFSVGEWIEAVWRKYESHFASTQDASAAGLHELADHSSVAYLTVHDLIWINSELTGTTHDFSYPAVENAIYHQYAYRDSRSVGKQAVQFARAVSRSGGFAQDNEATALIATLAFLHLNGVLIEPSPGEAATWIRGFVACDTMPSMPEPNPHHHEGPTAFRQLVWELIQRYETAFNDLSR